MRLSRSATSANSLRVASSCATSARCLSCADCWFFSSPIFLSALGRRLSSASRSFSTSSFWRSFTTRSSSAALRLISCSVNSTGPFFTNSLNAICAWRMVDSASLWSASSFLSFVFSKTTASAYPSVATLSAPESLLWLSSSCFLVS